MSSPILDIVVQTPNRLEEFASVSRLSARTLVVLVLFLSSPTHASWIEQCLFSGIVTTQPERAVREGIEVGDVVEFKFEPTSSVTLQPSHNACFHHHDRSLLVRLDLAGAEPPQRRDRLLIHYHYYEGMCGSDGGACRQTRYQLVSKSGWPSDEDQCHLPSEWWRQISGDPRIEAEEASKEAEASFLAVNGIARTLPGVDASMSCLMEKRRVNTIEGTSDALCNAAHSEFNERAYDYATAYNSVLTRLRRDLVKDCERESQ